MGKEVVNQIQEVPSPRQDKSKEEHTQIQLTKIKDKDKILKATREKQQRMRELTSGYHLIF